MRVRCVTTHWQPGTRYAPGHEPMPLTFEGEIAGCLPDEHRGDVFVIWDDSQQVFRKAPIEQCKVI